MKTLNRNIKSGDRILVKGVVVDVKLSKLINEKIIVNHSNGVSILHPFDKSELVL